MIINELAQSKPKSLYLKLVQNC